ncbi:MAG: trypsin-like peptidase domain-containing protein, partial [Verrucomicrobiota bacterium]
MKMKSYLSLAALAILGILSIPGLPAGADELKFADIEKRLTFDADQVETVNGAVASYADALEKVMPAVVTIFASKKVKMQNTSGTLQEDMLRRFFGIPEEEIERFREELPERQEQGLGSGVIISSDGYILTNNHVVGDAEEIQVSLWDGKKEFKAEVVGADPKTDVALIKVDAKNLQAITIGDSSKLRIGDVALAVGNPLGLDQTATVGIVSAVGRNDLGITNGGFENFIQTDAAINRG